MAGVRPALGVAEAQVLLTKLFGLPPDPDSQGQGKELDSYCDRNFLLHCTKDGQRIAVVLKVHNSSDSDLASRQTVEAQTCALVHLAQDQIPCPETLPSVSGNRIEAVELPSAPGKHGETTMHLVRCFKFIAGDVLGHAKQVPHSLFFSLGSMMGRVNASLAAFRHPGLSRTHAWSFETAGATMQDKLHLLPPEVLAPQQRALILWAAQRWQDAQATGRLAGLPRQACHGDANEMNVLVDAECASATALLDFGDMSETYAAAEPAIALAYALLLEISLRQRRRQEWAVQQGRGGGTSLEAGSETRQDLEAALMAGRALLDGYQQSRPLSAAELAMVPLLVATRVALSLTMGAAAAQADPGNAQYLLMTQGPGWVLLQALKDGLLDSDAWGVAPGAS